MELNGHALTLEQIAAVAIDGENVAISPSTSPGVAASRKVIEKIVARDTVVYGVNTGFGKLSDVRIPQDELRQLQLNLVRSHACGIGEPLSEPEVRAMMLLRANVLALGFSGIRCESSRCFARCSTGVCIRLFRKRARSAPAAISRRWRIWR